MCTLVLSAALALSSAQPAFQKVDRQTIESLLAEARKKHDVPAMGAMLIMPTGNVVAVVGVRKRGSDEKATVADQWHLGSDTKAMTALLIARLVEKKKFRLDSTLPELFPDLAEKIHDDLRKVTLEQLLEHRSGLRPNLPITWNLTRSTDPVIEQRQRATKSMLSVKPEAEPGSKFIYSNVNYLVAGHAAEVAEKASWEDLITQHVFVPLKMKSAGFGPAGNAKKVIQPWPHQSDGDPVKPDAWGDNPAVIGPAGRVHCSLEDWGKFVKEVMSGAEGKNGLILGSSYKRMLRANKEQGYTPGGWGRGTSKLGYVLSHDGSNTMNYCSAKLIPKAGIAILVTCNQGGDAGQEAVHEVVDGIMKRLTSQEK